MDCERLWATVSGTVSDCERLWAGLWAGLWATVSDCERLWATVSDCERLWATVSGLDKPIISFYIHMFSVKISNFFWQLVSILLISQSYLNIFWWLITLFCVEFWALRRLYVMWFRRDIYFWWKNENIENWFMFLFVIHGITQRYLIQMEPNLICIIYGMYVIFVIFYEFFWK